MHPRNLHQSRYDFNLLVEACPALKPFIQKNLYNDASIDFADPAAVKMLNLALLKQYYGIEHWDIPPGYLCPPIPGRADYIHHIADLLRANNYGKIPTGPKVRCLDVGVGANCVYPIIGHAAYGWTFVGADIDPIAIASAQAIIDLNPVLQTDVSCRLQSNPKDIFKGIIQDGEIFDLTICNPPFHASAEAAQSGTIRKVKNLTQKKVTTPVLNFGGQQTELWCEGGEAQFVRDMVRQSRPFATTCFWFSTLISKQSNLKMLQDTLRNAAATEVVTIPMGQGNKTSRVVAWSFLTKTQQQAWRNTRWNAGNAPKKG